MRWRFWGNFCIFAIYIYRMANIRMIGHAFILSFIFSSCSSSSMRIMATWVNKKDMPAPAPGQYKIFLFAMTQNYEAQINLENDLAAAALEKGIPTVKSIDAFGP